jgi:biopolymer transport protein ExbB
MARIAVLTAMFGVYFATQESHLATLFAQDEELVDPADEVLSGSDEGPADAASGDAADPTEKERSLLDTVADGGVVGILIFLLSVAAVSFIVEHSLSIRKSTLMPDHVMDELEELIRTGRVEEAIQACEAPDNDSMVSQVVQAGLVRYQGSEFGFAEYKAAVEEAGEDQTGRLYRKTEVLGLIGAIAPMLGLTGTVLGMIDAFNTIASSDGMAKPADLAGGIGQALVTTLMGLVVAIPAMIAHSFFRNKIDSIISEAGKRVEQIMMPLGRRRS